MLYQNELKHLVQSLLHFIILGLFLTIVLLWGYCHTINNSVQHQKISGIVNREHAKLPSVTLPLKHSLVRNIIQSVFYKSFSTHYIMNG